MDGALASGLPIVMSEGAVGDNSACMAVLAKFRAKVAKASNIVAVIWWQLARWAPQYHYALRDADGRPTRPFLCMMRAEGCR